MLTLPLPAAEYFVHVAWGIINGKTELSSQIALNFSTHPPTPPPQSPVLQPEPAFRDYIHRLIDTTAVSQSVVLIALLYLHRARAVLQRQLVIGDVIDKRQGYSMCAASLMLGNKYLDDNTYTSRTWATLSGYSLWEINDCEKRLLHALDFQLNIALPEYNDWWRFLTLYTPSPVAACEGVKADLAALSRPLTAEIRAPLMPVSQRRISRLDTSRPSSRKRSYVDPEVANVHKKIMLTAYQRPSTTQQPVNYQDPPATIRHMPAFALSKTQLYPCAVENSHGFQDIPLGYYKLAASPIDPRAQEHFRKFQLVEAPLQHQPMLPAVPPPRTRLASIDYPVFTDAWHSATLPSSTFIQCVQPYVSTTTQWDGCEQGQYTTYGDSHFLPTQKVLLDEQDLATHQLSIYQRSSIDFGHFK
ncbi:hypothetical protein NliqN6_5616 [Naganishia liquefaciens]|uniref:Cyclin N-terminal domain-containing protein n=1 Tax=Naganishia liquefaciens TaxID=104408 RepID=A0A8H3YGW9_9TREE|nr:hypothetical protein NliqN6_5616 [Naganishia liquefaciens]